MGIATALIASAVIGAGSAVYSSQQSKKAAAEQAAATEKAAAATIAAQEEAAAEAEANEKAILEGSVSQETATATFGLDDEDEETSSFSEFISPIDTTPTAGLGTTKSSGLGFGV